MCCTDRPTTVSGNAPGMAGGYAFPFNCGCGCLGNDPTMQNLNRYREHLKAELKHIENRISESIRDDQ